MPYRGEYRTEKKRKGKKIHPKAKADGLSFIKEL